MSCWLVTATKRRLWCVCSLGQEENFETHLYLKSLQGCGLWSGQFPFWQFWCWQISPPDSQASIQVKGYKVFFYLIKIEQSKQIGSLGPILADLTSIQEVPSMDLAFWKTYFPILKIIIDHPRPLFRSFLPVPTNRKLFLVLSSIRTWIVIVEGKHTDHYNTPRYSLYCVLYQCLL